MSARKVFQGKHAREEEWVASFEATAFPPPARNAGTDRVEHIIVSFEGKISDVIASETRMPVVRANEHSNLKMIIFID